LIYYDCARFSVKQKIFRQIPIDPNEEYRYAV